MSTTDQQPNSYEYPSNHSAIGFALLVLLRQSIRDKLASGASGFGSLPTAPLLRGFSGSSDYV